MKRLCIESRLLALAEATAISTTLLLGALAGAPAIAAFDCGGKGESNIFSGGVDVAFTDRGVPVGIGVSGAIDLGVLPVDAGVSATHACKLWSSR